MADPTLGDWFIYGGMAVGGAIATLLARAGIKKGAGTSSSSSELVVSGQASITDMAPLRTLATNVDLLTLKMIALTAAIEGMSKGQYRVAEQVGTTSTSLQELATHLKAYLEERERDERDREVERRVDARVDNLLKRSGRPAPKET